MDTNLKKGLTGKIFQSSEKDLKGNKTEDVTGRSHVINFCNRREKKKGKGFFILLQISLTI